MVTVVLGGKSSLLTWSRLLPLKPRLHHLKTNTFSNTANRVSANNVDALRFSSPLMGEGRDSLKPTKPLRLQFFCAV